MRKFWKVVCAILVLLLVTQSALAWELPDIKQTFTYKARARELSLGISFELLQGDRYSLEAQLTTNFIGLSALYHWVPVVEISSGFMFGYDPHFNQLDYGLVLFAFITW